MQVRLEPEIRESISIEELAKHIFNVIKKSKEDSHRSRNYPTILQNLLNDLCRNAGGNPLIDDDFAGKFDEAIALLKNQGLLVDVTSDVPKVRLTSLGEKSDLVLDANQLSKFIDKISNGDWYAVQHLFDYLNDKITNNPLYDKYEEKAKQWDEKSMESRIDLFKYELNTKNLSPEDVKALVYSFFKNNSNSNKLDAKIKIPDVQEFINRRLLHYLCDALDDIIKAQSDSSSKPEQKESVMEITSKTKIFVVHGRDQVKYELESLLRTWGLEPIILDEQIGGSKTIIEKFEEHSSKAQCAIVLLTPDDEGHLKGDKDLNPRARQNVIFEPGYFFAKLGRDRVICIYKNGVEIPSDIKGMNPITFDNSLKKDVYMMLSKELRAMGLSLND